MDRTLIAGTIIVIAITASAVFSLKAGREADPAAANVHQAQIVRDAPIPRVVRSINFSPKEKQAVTEASPADAELMARTEHKYRYLIADVDRAYVEELKRRLLDRENAMDVQQRYRIDSSIGELLPPDDYEYYQTLKDSDLEQHHLDEYTGGISSVSPLSDAQQRVVLEAKLRQKERYATVMRDMGLDRESLSEAERQFAHARSKEALRSYLNEFLQEVSPSLSPDQFSLLKNYETTEFTRELARVQQRINAK